MFQKKDYTILSKTLHHLALGSNFIPEMLHDIEVAIFKKKIKIDQFKTHIFICGLPRSGTTILMRSLYETNKFASLTYRDMPFVLLPNIWSKISRRVKTNVKKERAHKDSIEVNIDSPEALEEVFWRVKLEKKYIQQNKLIPHEVDQFTLNEFKSFVSLILYKYKKENYLSKNNNNILRIENIIQAFPDCLILIPFRDPLQQANSLLNQHIHFSKIQNRDKFIKKYMSYLAHYEFGLDHRPFIFSKNHYFDQNKNSISYWLEQWINTYSYLIQEKFLQRKNIIYVNYEHLCKNPRSVLDYINSQTNLKLIQGQNQFRLKYEKLDIKDNLNIDKANKIFEKLMKFNNNKFL
jgi:hypothetical protein